MLHVRTEHTPLGAASVAPEVPAGESDTYRKLHGELLRRGIRDFRFVRVPGPYYEKPLAFRAQRVGAASPEHMCKTMVMENTRIDCPAAGSDARVSKFFMVLVQYCATIHAEKLKQWVHSVRPLRVPVPGAASHTALPPFTLRGSCSGVSFGQSESLSARRVRSVTP